MIEILKDLPPTVVGFKASNEVTKEDYDQIIFPQIEQHIKEGFKLNYVFEIDTSLKNFTPGAWMQDAWLGLKNIARWRRVAIVSDVESIRNFTNTIGNFLPGEYKGFTSSELNSAIAWTASAS